MAKYGHRTIGDKYGHIVQLQIYSWKDRNIYPSTRNIKGFKTTSKKENINFKSMTTDIQVRQPIFLYLYWLGNPPRRYQESRQTEVYSSCSSSRRRGASWQMLRETFTAEQSKVARYIVHLSCFQCSPPYRTVKSSVHPSGAKLSHLSK